MKRRKTILEIVLFLTLLLCTAAKGYELYVGETPTYQKSFSASIVKPHSPVYYRVATTVGSQRPIVSNVAMIWFDETGKPDGSRVLGRGDFEVLQQVASKMSIEDATALVENLRGMSDQDYASFIKRLEIGYESQVAKIEK